MAKKKKFTNIYSEANEKKIIKEASKYDSAQSIEILLRYWAESGALQTPLPDKSKSIPRYKSVIHVPIKGSGSNDIIRGSGEDHDDGHDATQVAGCTDMYAINFNPAADLDNGSCCYDNECLELSGLDPLYGTEFGGGIPGDVTGDGNLDVTDIVFMINCILGSGNPNFDVAQCDEQPGQYIPPYNDCSGYGCDNCCDDEGYDCLPNYYTDPTECVECTDSCYTGWFHYGMASGQSCPSTTYGVCSNITEYCLDNECADYLCEDPILPVVGCTNPTACNYNSSAEYDDNTCEYPAVGAGCDCDNPTIMGECPTPGVSYCVEDFCTEIILGCTDASACNYNPLADTSCDSSLGDTNRGGGSSGYCRFNSPSVHQLCPCGDWMDFFFDVNSCYIEGQSWGSQTCNYDVFGEPPSVFGNFMVNGDWEGQHSSNPGRWIYNTQSTRKTIHPGYGDSQQQRATLDRYCLETCNGTPTSYEENIGWSLGTNPNSNPSGQYGFNYYNYSGAGFGTGVRWNSKPYNNSGVSEPDIDAWIDCSCQEQIQGMCEWDASQQGESTVGRGPNDCCCYIGDQLSADGVGCESDLSADGICACDGTINYGCGCDNIQKQTYYLDYDGDGFGCQNLNQDLCPSNELVVNETFVLNYNDTDCVCPNTCTTTDGIFMGSIFRIPDDTTGICKLCSNPGEDIHSQELVDSGIEEHSECCASAYGGIAEDYSVIEIDYGDETNVCASIQNSVQGYDCINISDEVISSCINDCGVCEPGVDTFLNLSCSGCTNPNACNYDIGATINNDSCTLPTSTTCYHQYEYTGCNLGEVYPSNPQNHWCGPMAEPQCSEYGQCMWLLSQNVNECYDFTTSVDLCAGDCTLLGDGWFNSLPNSVIEIECTVSYACNYTDPTSYNGCYINLDICDYPESGYDCNGDCLVGIEDCAGVCDGESVLDDCGVCRLNGNDYTGECVFGSGSPGHWCNDLGESVCLSNDSCTWIPSTFLPDQDLCGICFGNNSSDVGCGCDESAISMWWPDDDSDGLAQGVGVLKCSAIGTITPNTCGDGTADCLIDTDLWESSCSSLDTTTNTCNEDALPDCASNVLDGMGVCCDSGILDSCNVCDAENPDCSCVSCPCPDYCSGDTAYNSGSSTCTGGTCSACSYSTDECEGDGCDGDYCLDDPCAGNDAPTCATGETCIGGVCSCVTGETGCDGVCDSILVDDICGVCGGSAVVCVDGWYDYTGECLDGNTTYCNCSSDNTFDCEGTCGGSVEDDNCGNCGGTCESGNYGSCIGTEETLLSTCGVCGGNEPDEHFDCEGLCTESTDAYNTCCPSAELDGCNVCSGSNDTDLCGVCITDGGDNSSCSGCTDPIATNYNSDATVENGSCQYIDGCTDSTADNYDDSATADNGSCCWFDDLTNQQSLACTYLVDNSLYCDGIGATTYYDLYCTDSTDFVDASTHVLTDSVDRFVGDTSSVELQFPFNQSSFTDINFMAYTLQESKDISIINNSFYSEQPLSFTEIGGTLQDYDTYLQGIKVDINDSYQGTIIQTNEGSGMIIYIYWGSLAPFFGNNQGGWVIPDGATGQFVPGQGFLLLGGQFPGTYLKFYFGDS